MLQVHLSKQWMGHNNTLCLPSPVTNLSQRLLIQRQHGWCSWNDFFLLATRFLVRFPSLHFCVTFFPAKANSAFHPSKVEDRLVSCPRLSNTLNFSKLRQLPLDLEKILLSMWILIGQLVKHLVSIQRVISLFIQLRCLSTDRRVPCFMVFHSLVLHTLVPRYISNVRPATLKPMAYVFLSLLLWPANSCFLIAESSIMPSPHGWTTEAAPNKLKSRDQQSRFLLRWHLCWCWCSLRPHIHLSIACLFLSNLAMLIFLEA